MDSKTALLIGGSGLVGQFCLRSLLEDVHYGKVFLLTRRELPGQKHPKLKQIVIDFAGIETLPLDAIDDVFCAIGTTIRKACSQEAFRRVDMEFPLATARRSLERGAHRFILVSSVDANSTSRNFYLRTKGELEEELASLPFKAVHILRPSILVGQRKESRLGESIGTRMARLLQFALVGSLRRYRPIQAAHVGRAMVAAANSPGTGRIVYEYDEIERLAKGQTREVAN